MASTIDSIGRPGIPPGSAHRELPLPDPPLLPMEFLQALLSRNFQRKQRCFLQQLKGRRKGAIMFRARKRSGLMTNNRTSGNRDRIDHHLTTGNAARYPSFPVTQQDRTHVPARSPRTTTKDFSEPDVLPVYARFQDTAGNKKYIQVTGPAHRRYICVQ